jgi:predicted RNA-binding Zn ribbon-like protein
VRREPRYDVPKKAPGSLRIVQEFLNTRNAEAGLEWLETPEALRRWFADRGLGSPRVLRSDVERAHELREALRDVVAAGSPKRESVRRLERAADEAGFTLRFDAAGDATLTAASRGVSGALGRVLLAVAVAVADGTWARLKTCPNCRWAFYDHSRNRSAKWCSMTLCGNRLKTRAYYRRRASRPDS